MSDQDKGKAGADKSFRNAAWIFEAADICLHSWFCCIKGIVSVFDHAGIHPGTGFPALRKAIELGLMTSDYGDTLSNRRRMVQLTDKRRRVAKHLKDINNILSRQ